MFSVSLHRIIVSDHIKIALLTITQAQRRNNSIKRSNKQTLTIQPADQDTDLISDTMLTISRQWLWLARKAAYTRQYPAKIHSTTEKQNFELVVVKNYFYKFANVRMDQRLDYSRQPEPICTHWTMDRIDPDPLPCLSERFRCTYWFREWNLLAAPRRPVLRRDE